LRAGFIVRDMLGKKLDSFFKKWYKETQHYKTKLLQQKMQYSEKEDAF
jgi:hypothetical protein